MRLHFETTEGRKNMKSIKQFFGGFVLCAIEAVIGVLLLVDPVGFTSGIITFCGLALILLGIGSVVGYFLKNAEAAAASQGLAKGLTLLLAGGFCALKTEWILAAFPLLALIYGVVILVSGLGKLQWAVDLLRAKKKKWPFAAISAAVSLLCALVILGNPFATTAALWLFTGISMICEAVLDLVTFLLSGKKVQKGEEAAEEV